MTTIALTKLPRKVICSKAYRINFCRNMSVNKNSGQKLRCVFMKSVNSVHPGTLLQNQVELINDTKATLRVCGDYIELRNRAVRVLGFGKAVFGMAEATERILGNVITDGILIAPGGSLKSSRNNVSQKFTIMEGAKNNTADEDSIKATKIALDYVLNLNESDLLLVLISGGGSALLSLPVDGVDFREKARLIRDLADRGARIDQMNAVRKKLSSVKGGRLAQAAQPAQVVALTLSDVIGDRLDVIASGPTVPNAEPENSARIIIEQFGMQLNLSPTVRDYIYDRKVSQSSKNDKNFTNNTKTYIIGNNVMAAETAAKEARILGYQTCVLCTTVQGDVVNISKIYTQIAIITQRFLNKKIDVKQYIKSLNDICSKANEHNAAQIKLPANLNAIISSWQDFWNGVLLIFAGEPTVHVNEDAKGIGGRSQQLALLFSKDVAEHNTDNIWLLCGGTDGIDGPTDAAGAIACSNLARLSAKENLDIDEAINNCDSYSFFSKFLDGERLIKIGHTGTNVMDLHFLLVEKNNN